MPQAALELRPLRVAIHHARATPTALGRGGSARVWRARSRASSVPGTASAAGTSWRWWMESCSRRLASRMRLRGGGQAGRQHGAKAYAVRSQAVVDVVYAVERVGLDLGADGVTVSQFEHLAKVAPRAEEAALDA